MSFFSPVTICSSVQFVSLFIKNLVINGKQKSSKHPVLIGMTVFMTSMRILCAHGSFKLIITAKLNDGNRLYEYSCSGKETGKNRVQGGTGDKRTLQRCLEHLTQCL